MSEENVELARRGMRGPQEFIELLDEYVVFDQREFRLPDSPPVFMGKEAVIEMLRTYWGTFTDYGMEAEDILDAGESVVIVLKEHGQGKGSGVPLDRTWAQIWTFRRGRILRIEPYRTRTEALEAAGLSE